MISDTLHELHNELTSLAKQRDRYRAELHTAQGQLAAQLAVLRDEHGVMGLDEGFARREQLAEQIKQVGQWVREQIADIRRRHDLAVADDVTLHDVIGTARWASVTQRTSSASESTT